MQRRYSRPIPITGHARRNVLSFRSWHGTKMAHPTIIPLPLLPSRLPSHQKKIFQTLCIVQQIRKMKFHSMNYQSKNYFPSTNELWIELWTSPYRKYIRGWEQIRELKLSSRLISIYQRLSLNDFHFLSTDKKRKKEKKEAFERFALEFFPTFAPLPENKGRLKGEGKGSRVESLRGNSSR